MTPEQVCNLQMAYQAARALARIGTMAAEARAKAAQKAREAMAKPSEEA